MLFSSSTTKQTGKFVNIFLGSLTHPAHFLRHYRVAFWRYQLVKVWHHNGYELRQNLYWPASKKRNKSVR